MNEPRFKILRRDIDHVLLDSETRPGEISHSLEKVDGQWVCTCESANEGGNRECKHVLHMQELDRQIIRRLTSAIESEGPEFWELTDEEQAKIQGGKEQ